MKNKTLTIDDIIRQQSEKPPAVAFIREDECIGCTKCIQACPTDAILGASKLMHTIISDACTGCELCVEPCPVDCIDLKVTPELSATKKQTQFDRWRIRHQNHSIRLAREKQAAQQLVYQTLTARKTAIHAAVERVKMKKEQQHESSKA